MSATTPREAAALTPDELARWIVDRIEGPTSSRQRAGLLDDIEAAIGMRDHARATDPVAGGDLAPGAPGTLLDAIGNAVYEAGVGRAGPDPTWKGVTEAAHRVARAWFDRRAAAPASEAATEGAPSVDEIAQEIDVAFDADHESLMHGGGPVSREDMARDAAERVRDLFAATPREQGTAEAEAEGSTLYDLVHAALLAEHTPLPAEPNPCIVAAGVDYLTEKITTHVEASGLLAATPREQGTAEASDRCGSCEHRRAVHDFALDGRCGFGVSDSSIPGGVCPCARYADAPDRVEDGTRGEGGPVTTAEVGGWDRARFGNRDAVRVALKLAGGVGEVAEAVVKRDEGALRPAKGLTTREDWTRHLHTEIGDVGIVLHVLCAREGTTLDEVVTRRFRDDVSKRTGQERSAPRLDEQCPTCTSPQPHLHPALAHEGEVQVCPDPWHRAAPAADGGGASS